MKRWSTAMLFGVLILALIENECLGQYNTTAEVKPIAAQVIMADAVTTYKSGDRVAVILEKPDPKPSLGAILEINTEAKWISVQAGPTFEQLRALTEVEAGKFLLVGQAGKYLVLIVESSPDGPPVIQFLSVSLGTPQPEPEDPTDPPVPPGDFTSVTDMVKQSVLLMNEPRVATALLAAYSRIAESPTLTYGDVSKARQDALLALRGVSRPWDVEFQKWETEIARIGVADPIRYRQSIRAIVSGFRAAGVSGVATVNPTVKYRQVCVGGVCYWVAE